MDEEEWLRRELGVLADRYRKAFDRDAEPLRKRLCEIEAAKPRLHIIPLSERPAFDDG